MNFMGWLSSLDELLYEVMSWILFLPITLWRTLRNPIGMMDYADAELSRADEGDQYQDALSPPLLLILCLLIAHALSLSLGQGDEIIASRRGLAGLVNDETSLLLLRVVLFGSFPLFMAGRLARKQGIRLTRAALKPAFYAHCYPVGLLALIMGAGTTAVGLHERWGPPLGGALVAIAMLGYGIVAAAWFARRLAQPFWRGFLHASVSMLEGLIMVVILAVMFAP